jgi:hypothetical protein
VRTWLLEATEELVPRRGAKLRLVAAEQLRRYGSVFAGYRAVRHWYFSVEVWFAIATGAATGLMLRAMGGTDPCAGAGWGWGVVAVGAVETAAALLLRAFALRLELVVFASVMLLTMAAEIVALVDPNAVEASNGLSTAAAVLQIVAMLYGAVGHYILRRRGQLVEVVPVVATLLRESETVGRNHGGSRDNRKAKRRRFDFPRNNQQSDTLLLLSGRVVEAKRSIDVALALRKVIEIICESTGVVGVDTM